MQNVHFEETVEAPETSLDTFIFLHWARGVLLVVFGCPSGKHGMSGGNGQGGEVLSCALSL